MKSYHSYLLNDLSCDRETLTELLTSDDIELRTALFSKAEQTRNSILGNKVFFRGLIEYSNICSRDCHYCGIRCSNQQVYRYEMSETEVLEAAIFAWKNKLGSIVIQSGERNDRAFIMQIGSILEKIRNITFGNLKVTLSCGEQSEETFRYWRNCGASRYLLRIETSNTSLFQKLHPADGRHLFSTRLRALQTLKNIGYQTGTGVMIGIPGQTAEMLAMDLAFFRNFDVDMVGMGPYIEHSATNLHYSDKQTYTLQQRLELSFRMIALLRLLMTNINIAASTALQAIEPEARLNALRCGANVIMPNITPLKYREDYLLYDNKPGLKTDGSENIRYWNEKLNEASCIPAWEEMGDPLHFKKK